MTFPLRVYYSWHSPKQHSPRLHTQPLLVLGTLKHVRHFSSGNCHLVWFLWCIFLMLLPSEVPKLTVRQFPIMWKLIFHNSLHKTGLFPENLCHPFCLYPLPYLIPRRLASLSGHLESSASIHKLFSGSYSTCRWSLWRRCISGRENGLPMLVLCHLGTAPHL